MASSSRSRSRAKNKPGQGRMDAAHDHLLQYGFTKKQITSTVKSLLKVYGDDGWVFLEESGYKLVLDSILDQTNASDEEPTCPQLPAPLPPAPEEENGGAQQQKGGNDADKGMEEQRYSNGGSEVPTIATGAPLQIEFMDENLLHIIPPGRARAPLYGYLSESDSDIDF